MVCVSDALQMDNSNMSKASVATKRDAREEGEGLKRRDIFMGNR